MLDSVTQVSFSNFLFIDMASAAFIEPLPVIEFVAQLLSKDVLSRPLSDSDRIKVLSFILAMSFGVFHLYVS